MKKAILLLSAVFVAMAANAQISSFPYTQGFENGLGDWTTVDADGDGNGWNIVSSSVDNYTVYEGNYVITSASWLEGIGALTPDNWLISPAIVLPEESSLSLVWYSKPQDSDWPRDKYSVYLSTNGTNIEDFTEVLFTLEFPFDTINYVRHAVSLEDYAGSTVYVAFRHHDCTDMFSMNIDAISVLDDRAPIASIEGPAFAHVGEPATFVGSQVAGVEEGSEYLWHCEDVVFSEADAATTEAIFSAVGNYTVELIIENAYGKDTAKHTLYVMDCSVAEEVPYSYQFNIDTTCWYGDNWELNTGNYDVWGEDTVFLAISWSVDEENEPLEEVNDYLYSPIIAIPEDGQYELKYFVYPVNDGDHYSVSIRQGENEELLFEENTEGSEMYMRKLFVPAAYAGQNVQFIFNHTVVEDAEAYALAIANPEVRPITAPEVSVIAPRNARNTETVELGSMVASAVAVDYAWTIEGAEPATSDEASVSATWTGAEEGYYRVRLTVSNSVGSAKDSADIYVFDCAKTIEAPYTWNFDNGMGCWDNYNEDDVANGWNDIDDDFVAMGFPSGAASVFARGEQGSCVASWGFRPMQNSYGWMFYQYGFGENTPADNYLVSPAISLGEGSWKVAFWVNSILGDRPSYRILVATTEPTSAASFTEEVRPLADAVIESTGDYHHSEFDLSAFANQTIWIAFEHVDPAGERSALLIDDLSIEQGQAVGVSNVDAINVSVYPNPATDVINVRGEGIISVEVIDVAGRVVRTAEGEGAINTTDLSAGTYMVRTVTNQGVCAKRIVKK